jgi:hypothetical protein
MWAYCVESCLSPTDSRYFLFFDKYIDRSDFQIVRMDNDSSYFAFSGDDIDKIIKPDMREENEKD